MKKVFLSIASDVIHHGHINIIEVARKLGEVTIGLMTDEGIASYKRIPLLTYEQRKRIIENLKGVSKVIPQDGLKDYIRIIKELKPDYVVHGTDWREGIQKNTREKVIEILKEIGGELVEPEYTKGVSSTALVNEMLEIGTTPDIRLTKLRKILKLKPIVRFLEVHNGLTGRIVEKTKVNLDGEIREFDGMWISSLTDSISKGKPDIEYVDFTSKSQTIDQICDVTTKPIIVDGDTGGLTEHFCYTIKTLERFGVSAIIIEDKIGPKRNSLFGTDVDQTQDDIENFCNKISAGKRAQVTEEFMIIARIESLILKKGMNDALERAYSYIQAGADWNNNQSKEKNPNEIITFCKAYQNFEKKVPLIVVPTTYNKITEQELIDLGVNIVIYANHLLRSAYPSMLKTAETILKNGRAFEVEEMCLPIEKILTLIPGGK